MDIHKIISLVPGIVYQFRLRPDGSACVPYASEAVREIYRLAPEEIREDASKVFIHVHPDDLENHLASIQASARSLTPWRNEYRLRFDNGAVRWLYGNALPQREADGSILWHGFITDITEQKNSEERLRQSEEKLRAYLDNISDTIWLIDANLNMVYVSPSVTRLLGVLPAELIGRPSALVIHPDDMGVVTNAQHYVMEHPGEPHTIQYRVSHKDGRWIDVESTGVNMLGNPVINGVLVTMRDVSERKLAEAALRASENRYRLLVEFSPFCIHEIDLEGRFQSMNKAGLDMLGLDDAKNICGMPYLGLVSQQDAGCVEALLQDAIANGTPSHFEFAATGDAPLYFKSCFIPIKDASGKVLKLMGITEDITEHKKIEDELKQTKERYDFATAIGKVGTWDWNPATNDLIWSDETFRLMGVAPGSAAPSYELFLGKVHPDDREFLDNAVQAALRDKKTYTLDCRIISGNGDELTCHVTGKVEFDAKDQPIRMLGTIHDITGRKQIEDALRESEARQSAILNNSPYLTWLKDTEGRYLKVNKAYADYAQLENQQQAIGKTDFDLWPRELAEKYRTDDAEVMTSRQQKRVEEPSLNGDEIHWAETFKTPVIDDSGNVLGTAGFARDITDRKQAEQALIESESRFREIFNAVSDAIFIHDAETGRIVDVNRRMCEMYSITREEAFACGPDDLGAGVPPYSSAEAIDKLRLARAEGPQTFDWLARARDGRFFWVEVSLQFAHIGRQQRILAVVRDISERKHVDAELRIAAIAFESQDGMVVTNADSVILRINRAFTEITGYTAEEVVGQTPRMLKSGHHDVAFYAAMWESIRHTGSWHGEIWNRRKNGEVYPEQLTITAVKGEAGETTHYVATLRDITERKTAEEEIYHLAFYDALTKLPNRRLLDDRLRQAIAASKRSGLYGALMFIDLDNFKPLNDTHGHDVGDLLLIEASRRIASCVREVDTVARFGGDEFVVMLSELDTDKAKSTAQMGAVAEKIHTILAEPYVLKFQQEGRAETIVKHHCTSSIGVVLFVNHGSGPEDILKWADMAMYQAKTGGRNRVQFYGS